MSGLPAQVKRVQETRMKTSGLARAGTHSVWDNGEGSLYACLPAIACRNFDVEGSDDVQTYIDFENNAIIHIIPEDGGE